jgi:hypothetical protein
LERVLRAFLKSAFLLFHVALSLTLACGSGEDADTTGTPSPADAGAIRDVDFESLPEMVALLERLGSGRVATEAVVYEDLTGDLREEAIVPITSDGTLGNVAYLVYSLRSGKPELILTRTMDRTTASGLVMGVDDFGTLTETVGVYGAEDPLCCPSVLRLTTFSWDGSALQVAGEVKEDNPNKAKQ